MQKTITAQPGQLDPAATNTVIKQAFGRHAVSVAFPAKAGADALGWCAAIFQSVADEARKDRPTPSQIATLAEVGQFLASFHEESISGEYDEIMDRLASVGIKGEVAA